MGNCIGNRDRETGIPSSSPKRENVESEPDIQTCNPPSDPTRKNVESDIIDIQALDIQDRNWKDYFIIGDEFQSHNFRNSRQTRILVLSGTKVDETRYNTNGKIYTVLNCENLKNEEAFREDCERIKLLEQSPQTNKMLFKIVDLSSYFPNARTMLTDKYDETVQRLIRDIKTFWPTMIILGFSSEIFSKDPVPMDYRDIGFKYDRLDVAKELLNHKILQALIIRNKNCMFFNTKNIFQTDKCVFTSATPTSVSGLETSVPGFLNELISLGNPFQTRILIISGSHGDKHSKMSGFTHRVLLDYNISDNCIYIFIQ